MASYIQSHSSVIVGQLAAFFLAGKGRTSPTGAVVEADSEPTALVAVPGRVEPVSACRYVHHHREIIAGGTVNF